MYTKISSKWNYLNKISTEEPNHSSIKNIFLFFFYSKRRCWICNLGSLFFRWLTTSCWLYCSFNGGISWTHRWISGTQELWTETSWTVYMVVGIGSLSWMQCFCSLLEHILLLNSLITKIPKMPFCT